MNKEELLEIIYDCTISFSSTESTYEFSEITKNKFKKFIKKWIDKHISEWTEKRVSETPLVEEIKE